MKYCYKNSLLQVMDPKENSFDTPIVVRPFKSIPICDVGIRIVVKSHVMDQSVGLQALSAEKLGSLLAVIVLDLWWIVWHRDRCFSAYFNFIQPASFRQCFNYLSIYLFIYLAGCRMFPHLHAPI